MAHRRRKKETNKGAIWMGTFVIVVMVASTLAIVFNNQNSSQGSLRYNGYNIEFDVSKNQYSLSENGQIHNFYYHPTELETYEVDPISMQVISSAQYVFVSNDPNIEPQYLPYQDLFRFELTQSLNKQFIGAIQTENPGSTFPVITCDNATVTTPVIMLNDSADTGVFVEGTCVTVNAQGVELLRMKDLFTYYLLGVMPNDE